MLLLQLLWLVCLSFAQFFARHINIFFRCWKYSNKFDKNWALLVKIGGHSISMYRSRETPFPRLETECWLKWTEWLKGWQMYFTSTVCLGMSVPRSAYRQRLKCITYWLNNLWKSIFKVYNYFSSFKSNPLIKWLENFNLI